MRVQFLQDVDVELKDVPRTAFGAIGIRHSKPTPRFGPEKGVELKVVEPVSKHYYRKDKFAEMPDEMAQSYIDSGVAKKSPVEVIRGPVPGYEDFTQ